MKVLKFSASWCSPCKILQTIIDDMSNLPIDIESIDIDIDTKLAQQYNIRGVPTLVMIDDTGNEIKRNVGMITRDKLLEWLK
jgi:thioredoxin 1